MRSIIRLYGLILVVLALAAATSAQTTSGSITGSVTDPQQSAVAGATVNVTDEAKSLTLTATTDKEGRFVFPQVPPGNYKLTIEATGFKKMERTDILLVANDKLTLGDLALEVGQASETVTVTAEATLVQAESAERSYAVQGEVVRNIAVNGRGVTALASIVPGLASTTNMGTPGDITNISANGMRTNSNNLQLDGVATVDTGNNGNMFAITLDSVAEFKVLTSNYQAEYGRAAGAQISAVTRSGTKEFHGSFYTFRRHDGMNANTWINNHTSSRDAAGNLRNFTPKPKDDQRDIGYTIGGPVWIPKIFNESKEKVFFFFNQEHQKRFTPPAGPVRVRIPTELERAGDFSKTFPFISDPEARAQGLPCNASDTRGCFQDGGVIGKIPQNRLYQPGLNILKIYPLPNATGADFNYSTEAPTSDPQRQDLYRGDWNINNSWRASGKYIFYKRGPTQPYGSFVLGTNLPDYPSKFPNNRYAFSGTVTGSINATTVLEVTFGQTHNSIDILPANDKFNRAGLNLTDVPVLFPDAVEIDLPPQFGFNGGSLQNGPNIGSNNAPFYNYNTTRDLSVNLSKIWNSHNLKFGLFWQNSYKPQSSFAANNGNYNFGADASNPLDTGFGFANAAIGVYNTFAQASDYIIGNYRYNNIEWYAQDNWKVTNRLTLDYGMRFYWIQPQYDEALQTSNFLPGEYKAADASLLFRPVCIGANPCSGPDRRAVDPRLLVPGFVATTDNTIDGANIGRLVPGTGKATNGLLQAGQGIERGVYRNRGVHFAPRFGFAYDIRGDQLLVIRGGAGVFYDRPQGNTVFDLVRNPPTTKEVTFSFGRMEEISPEGAFVAPPSLVAFDPQGKIPTIYAYNLGVQYKLPFEAVLDVSYVGTSGQHLLQQRNINAPDYGAAYLPENQDPTSTGDAAIPGARALPVEFLRPFQGYGQIRYIEPASSSNYHSLQTSLNRRFRRGLLLGVNYTWSKALGTQSNDLQGVAGFGAAHILDNRRANYGPLDFDRRHNFNVNWVWELPKATENRALGYALNNWQFSGVYRYVTGEPYNILFTIPGVSGYTLTGTQNIEGARIVLLKNPGSGHSDDPYRQFDVSAFTIAGPGSTGYESGRNFLYRAPINSFDLSLAKRFRFKEKAEVEIRIDAFNALNHTQFNFDTNSNISLRLNVRGFDPATGLIDPTPTNLASETGNPTGFGAVTAVRPPRQLQLAARFRF
jgi:outer membrane receptor protein involved in Fe transport